MFNEVKKHLEKLLGDEKSGHGMDHINRVFDVSMEFAKKENCDSELVGLIALLHDADDYKLFGYESQENLTNTKMILSKLPLSEERKEQVLKNVATIGYSKRLKGLTPPSIEGKIVSDADMCDAIGAIGILRVNQYQMAHGRAFFDRNAWPMEDMSGESYARASSASGVCHMFEKVLRLKGLMLTEEGKKEILSRHQFTVTFLRQLFKEHNAPEWEKYLDEFLKRFD